MANPPSAPPFVIGGRGKYHTTGNPEKPLFKISWSYIRAAAEDPDSVSKDQAIWMIPSTLESRVHAVQEANGAFYYAWADLDGFPPRIDDVAAHVETVTHGADFEIFSTRSATSENRKLRIIIPLAEPLCGGVWLDAQALLNDSLEAAQITPDRASEACGQLCYLPNRGLHYETRSRHNRQWFDPLKTWDAELTAKRERDEIEAALAAERREEARRKAKAKRETLEPTRDLIGTFNATISLADVLIGAGYVQHPTQDHRFRHSNSESGSFSATIKNGRVHSLSASDPLSTQEGAHDCFSAFCEIYHEGDQKAAMIDAGNHWLSVGGQSWNAHHRQKRREAGYGR